MTRFSAAVTALALLALVGCGNPATAPDAAPTLPSVTNSASPTPSPYRLPKGMRLVTATKSGVRFAIPRTWTKLDASKIYSPSSKEALSRLAAKRNLTLSQFRQIMAQIDMMAIASTMDLKEYGELNVVSLTALAEIPPRAALRAQFKSLNIKVLGFRTVSTPLGEALLVETQGSLNPTVSTYMSGLFVEMNSGVVNLNTMALRRARSQQQMEDLIPSLRESGNGGSAVAGSA